MDRRQPRTELGEVLPSSWNSQWSGAHPQAEGEQRSRKGQRGPGCPLGGWRGPAGSKSHPCIDAMSVYRTHAWLRLQRQREQAGAAGCGGGLDQCPPLLSLLTGRLTPRASHEPGVFPDLGLCSPPALTRPAPSHLSGPS